MFDNKTYDEETDWKQLQIQLEAEKWRVMEEIANYPPPIPACDVQFNFLLEERARITRELNRLQALSRERLLTPEAQNE
jgi:hypothetical protein